TFVVLLGVGITISFLTSRIRHQTAVATQREKETAVLYALGRDLAISKDLQSSVEAVVLRLKETFGYQVTILLPEPGRADFKAYGILDNREFQGRELEAVRRCYHEKQRFQQSPEDSQERQAFYLPLMTAKGITGVMLLRAVEASGSLNPEQERLLEAYTDLVAVAIEGIKLSEELRDTEVLKATEKLQDALLNSISHDLRTPLVSIIGTLSSLQEEHMEMDTISKMNLIQVAREEAERLNHLITNLLDESKIEAGALTLSKQPSEVQDLIGAALEHMGTRSRGHAIRIDIPDDVAFVCVDFGLIVQVLINIIDNAIKYSPPGSSIDIGARQAGQKTIIEISDQGIGIPEQDLPYIFDKFYRIKRPDNVTGTGLGLSISKGIVEVHGGRIEAVSIPGGGTLIRIYLPSTDFTDRREEKMGEKCKGDDC
ncbi:MAG: hypothetical protein JW954_08045, partial [Dehalococcoidaceae bacterium]|nr:hypothetical protein [Dehalococcoidaceae bacterium]